MGPDVAKARGRATLVHKNQILMRQAPIAQRLDGPSALLFAKDDNRVHARGAARGRPAGQHRDPA
jgi:hypothetical protein